MDWKLESLWVSLCIIGVAWALSSCTARVAESKSECMKFCKHETCIC